MRTFQNIEISENEVNRILAQLKMMSVNELMDNITIAKAPLSDYWDIRLSKVSAKDLEEWDDSKFTDGNNNGRSLLIKMNGMIGKSDIVATKEFLNKYSSVIDD